MPLYLVCHNKDDIKNIYDWHSTKVTRDVESHATPSRAEPRSVAEEEEDLRIP